jgi:hypothetical protein
MSSWAVTSTLFRLAGRLRQVGTACGPGSARHIFSSWLRHTISGVVALEPGADDTVVGEPRWPMASAVVAAIVHDGDTMIEGT